VRVFVGAAIDQSASCRYSKVKRVATIDFASATVGVDVTSGHIVASWAGAA